MKGFVVLEACTVRCVGQALTLVSVWILTSGTCNLQVAFFPAPRRPARPLARPTARRLRAQLAHNLGAICPQLAFKAAKARPSDGFGASKKKKEKKIYIYISIFTYFYLFSFSFDF